MPDNERALYDHILKGYQNRLAAAEFEALREQAHSAQKDRRIAELTEQISKLRAPKPGPR